MQVLLKNRRVRTVVGDVSFGQVARVRLTRAIPVSSTGEVLVRIIHEGIDGTTVVGTADDMVAVDY